jgi:hypothetical protein
MDETQIVDECFWGPGIDARLRCDGQSCILDVTIDGRLVDPDRPPATLEVLMQPVDRATGRPRGSPARLLRERLRLVYIRDKGHAAGRSWLPGIEPSLARDCYYRITPQTS